MVADINHLGRGVAAVDQSGIGVVEFIQNTVRAGHAGNGLHWAGHAGDGCRSGEAEQSGEECTSIHQYLLIFNQCFQSTTNRRWGRYTLRFSQNPS
jgi:hypothetical protein